MLVSTTVARASTMRAATAACRSHVRRTAKIELGQARVPQNSRKRTRAFGSDCVVRKTQGLKLSLRQQGRKSTGPVDTKAHIWQARRHALLGHAWRESVRTHMHTGEEQQRLLRAITLFQLQLPRH